MSLPADLVVEIRAGLSARGQKRLPSRYLYDDLGSALFEAICYLPEYGLWRAGSRLLRRNAEAIADMVAPSEHEEALVVAELGSGGGQKTRHLLERLGRRGRVRYHPIDVSAGALRACVAAVSDVAGVATDPHETTYEEGLREIASARGASSRALVLFLGSTIGNFEPPQARTFLCEVRRHLRPDDGLFLSTDLVKPVDALLAAYDDPRGLTGAFNLNLLARLNRDLGGTFVLDDFRHEARWNEHDTCIEMHLRATRAHEVRIGELGLRVRFDAHETILTERCHKFTTDEVAGMGEGAGFRRVQQWIDEEWPFAQTLFTAV